MQYRTDTKSGNELSILGFGCMRFPRSGVGFSPEKTEKLILQAIERGVNYFDTAYLYFNSEEVLGEILRSNNLRDKVFLTTKLPLAKCKIFEDFESLFQTQLKRLQTDHFDYYLMHNLSNPATWERLCALGIEKWLSEKKASGQIRHVGFSFHGSHDDFSTLLDAYDWEICQIQYNYVNVNYQAGQAGLRKAATKGIPVVVMEPLLGGKLATGLPKKAVGIFKDADSKRSPAEWSLRWLWNQPEVTVVLSGMNSSGQIDENTSAAETSTPGMFTDSESALFTPVEAAFRESYKVPCTGCNYCMPCPQHVNIPACFAAYNASYAVGFGTGIQQYITSTGSTSAAQNSGVRHCVKCGRCEKQCPQHIEIIKSLEAVSKRMEPLWLRAAMAIYSKFS